MSGRTERRSSANSTLLLSLLGLSAGALIANLYYAQPLVTDIADDLGMTPALAGSVVSLTQVGYAIGMLALVPLSDLVENKRLIMGAFGGVLTSLTMLMMASSVPLYLFATALLGVSCAAAQVIIPLVAHLFEGERQGRAVASVMAMILSAVTVARPAALMIADVAGWRAVYATSLGIVAILAVHVVLLLPKRTPALDMRYAGMLRSMIVVFRAQREVPRRALYQASMFAAFNIFWVAAPIVLTTQLGLSKAEVAAFALVGAAGALAAPVSARIAALGMTERGTIAACVAFGVAFGLSNLALTMHSLVLFVALAMVLDAAFHVSQTFGRLVALAVDPSVRGRVNSLYMVILFGGGAMGSLVAPASLELGGWVLVSAIGAGPALIVAGFVLHGIGNRRQT